MTLGIRLDVINYLQTTNPISTERQDRFANMKIQPPVPFHSFYETRKTKVGRFKYLVRSFHRHGWVTLKLTADLPKQVVTPTSATLNKQAAIPMEGVDHHRICKFDNKFGGLGGYVQVIEKLNDLKDRLSNLQPRKLPRSNVQSSPRFSCLLSFQ